jgi:ankyrin repeat protein
MKTITSIILSIFLFAAPFQAANAVAIDNKHFSVSDDIFEAVKNIDITSLNILLSEGADVDTVNQDGDTPLMLASEIGNMRMLNILLLHDPDVNMKNQNGKTALMIASENGQLYVTDRLLQAGAKTYLKSNRGETAVELAAKNGHKEVLDLLNGKEVTEFSR